MRCLRSSPFITTHSSACVCICACVCCRPVVTQLHNRFQFPSPACLVAPRPPLLSAACLTAWLLGGLGQIRADQFRVLSSPSTRRRLNGRTWQCHGGHSCPAAASITPGAGGKVCTEVRNVLLFLIISARMANSSVDVGRDTFQPNFDAAGWTSSLSVPLPPPALTRSSKTQSASPCTHAHAVCSRERQITRVRCAYRPCRLKAVT